MNKGLGYVIVFDYMWGISSHKKAASERKKERAGKEREGLVRYMNVCTTRRINKYTTK